ncbi:hypothetical protein [Shewanella surugensis]|uniref:Uncharacterized protein n=1 Tax=Shewanella surugensis TaxID=212020 RepID=A0ABT0L6X7_9GAMM|nr:hypothetical protein [Shewanella surugensis]MCL1123438.1 hypothetical protein [Shewanella surugensis]
MLVWFKRRLLYRLPLEGVDAGWKNFNNDNPMCIWEHIAEFFYGVNQEEAQQALFDLSRIQICDSKKYDAFNRLRTLAAEVFCDKFREEGVKNKDGSWDITIQIKGWQINQDILQLNLKAVNAMY